MDVYKSTGQLELRLEHGDWLNAPWGVALASLDFGRFSHDLLIGQLAGGGTTESSGFVAAYDLAQENSTGCCKTRPGSRSPSMEFGRSAPGMAALAATIPLQHQLPNFISPPGLIMVPEDCSGT